MKRLVISAVALSAVLESYTLGYDRGYNTGISDAAAAYKSGGILNATTGEIIRQ